MSSYAMNINIKTQSQYYFNKQFLFMKKLLFTLFATSLLFAFTGCGNDDEYEDKTFIGDCLEIISLESGPAENTNITQLKVSKLEDKLKGSTGFGAPIKNTAELYSKESFAEIKGLPDGTILKEFKLTINGKTESFGEISTEKNNLVLYTSSHDEYFKNVFNQMVRDGALKVQVSFIPTVQVTKDVKLEISFRGRFTYSVKI